MADGAKEPASTIGVTFAPRVSVECACDFQRGSQSNIIRLIYLKQGDSLGSLNKAVAFYPDKEDNSFR